MSPDTTTKRIASILLVLAMGCSQFSARVDKQTSVGWRGDGLGRYPYATPPIEWSNEKNVAWAADLPSWSNGTPVVVGDRIFVCSEPFDLICLSKKDGEILWRESCGYQSLFMRINSATHKICGHWIAQESPGGYGRY